jgi:uncharacterized RDD family membrane protein YckC
MTDPSRLDSRPPTYVAVDPMRAVPGARIAAYGIDFVIVGLVGSLIWVVIALLGVLTFGFTWLLLGAVFPVTAILYNALTISGGGRGTWGMRLFGVEAVRPDGTRADFVTAGAHALLFYMSITFFTPLVLLVALLRDDRRLLHDLVTGIVVRRS